jgi:ATP-dependent protease ClpP protease subunit
MEHEIYLYGAIIHDSDPAAAEWGFVTLRDVNKQLDAIPADHGDKNILVRINSEGGDVDTGFAIYSALRRKASEGFTITTRMDGIAASIATVVFLAGDQRIGNEFIDPFIHNAWTFGGGDAEDFEKISKQLKKTNERIAKFYSEHTNLTEEKALDLMDKDTSLDPAELVSMGFATEIEELLRPAALKQIYAKHKPLKTPVMSKEKDTQEEKVNSFMNKLEGILNKFTNKNEKTLQNENGEELVFASLADTDMVEEGNSATINSKSAEGEHIIPSLNKVITFEKGKVTAIEDRASEEDEETVETLRAEKQELETELSNLKAEHETLQNSMKEIKTEVTELKNLASGFSHEGSSNSHSQAKDPEEEQSKKPKTRKMFAKKHYEN